MMPDEVVRESAQQPRGSAGLVNQGSQSTVDDVAAAYGAVAAATAAAAMEKRESDWQSLMGAHAPGGY